MRVSAFRLVAAALSALVLSASAACNDDTQLLAPGAASGLRDPVSPPTIPPLPPGAMLSVVVDIASGANHVCARFMRGGIACWGRNSEGEIGVASTDSCGELGYGVDPCVPRPTFVTGSATVNGSTQSFSGVSRIAVGERHTCVLAARGSAWCWGSNLNGELGNGTTNPVATGVSTPTPVAGPPFTAISAGAFATCGVSDSALYCWGQLTYQLPSSTTPQLLSLRNSWTDDLKVGANNACARSTTAGWTCWGSNVYGQLGEDPHTWPYFQGPFGSPLFNHSTSVVSTHDYTCFEMADGTLQCMGANDAGQIGEPTFNLPMTFDPFTVGGSAGLQLSHVAMNRWHACALNPQGQAYCWGEDHFGELGRGVSGDGHKFPTPAPVVGGLTFIKLAAGRHHTCGLTTDHRVFCWGSNYSGQLGFPNHTHLAANPSPVEIVF